MPPSLTLPSACHDDDCPSKSEERYLISGLVCAIEAAIRLGDWKVDGRCDPDAILHRAKTFLDNNPATTGDVYAQRA